MSAELKICHIVTEQPALAENQVERLPVKKGENLQGSIEEDIGSFSLCPTYSSSQLRAINRRIRNQYFASKDKSHIQARHLSKYRRSHLSIDSELSDIFHGEVNFNNDYPVKLSGEQSH